VAIAGRDDAYLWDPVSGNLPPSLARRAIASTRWRSARTARRWPRPTATATSTFGGSRSRAAESPCRGDRSLRHDERDVQHGRPRRSSRRGTGRQARTRPSTLSGSSRAAVPVDPAQAVDGSKKPPPRKRLRRRPRPPSRSGSTGPQSPARPVPPRVASRRRGGATGCSARPDLRAVPEAARVVEITAGGPVRCPPTDARQAAQIMAVLFPSRELTGFPEQDCKVSQKHAQVFPCLALRSA
jgi:hypothetical protein